MRIQPLLRSATLPRRGTPRGFFFQLHLFILITATVLGALFSGASPAAAAGLLVADGGFGGVLTLEEHEVEVTINNGIAVTHVTQVFQNTEDRIVEALYTFPVPKGASVANFQMWIDGTEMVGEVVEKERARRIYNSYKRRGVDPGLLEQVDYKSFEMRIFPIGPRASQRVQITYYQELDFDADWATYVYPLATTTRADADSQVRGRFALDVDILSEVPVKAVESPSHDADFAIARHGKSYAQASLEAQGGDLSRDVVLAFQVARPRTGLDLISTREPGEDGYFLLTLTPGEELAALETGMDYLFILDISGSMDDAGKLDLSRRSAGAFIAALGPQDRFEVMSFNVRLDTLFGELRPAGDAALQEAETYLASRSARGGTVLRPALETAYRYKDADRPLNVVLLSDGLTQAQERRELLAAVASRPAASRLFAIGVGNDVNRPMLRQLAQDAGGLAAFVSRGADFERQARAFRRKLTRPAASNVEIELAGGGIYDREPQTLPDLFHGAPLRIYGRYREGGPVRVRLSADVGGERLERELEIEIPRDGDANPELERMWAWHRVQRLLDEADRQGSRDRVIDEVVRLGEAYSIVTEYTSFLVLENDAEYERWKIERRNALRIERDRKQQQRLRERLEAMRSQAASELGPVDPEESKKPQQLAQSTPPDAPGNRRPAQDSSGWDLDLGGGAVDPASAGLALLLTGLALAGGRGLRRSGKEDS